MTNKLKIKNNITVLCAVTPCSLVYRYKYFYGTYWLQLQSQSDIGSIYQTTLRHNKKDYLITTIILRASNLTYDKDCKLYKHARYIHVMTDAQYV